MKAYKIDQKSDEWFKLRKGKITGTGLKRIIGSKKTRDSYFYEILAERLTVGNPTEESALERGNRLEDEAISQFEKETGKIVDRFGLCESDENDGIAQSPDGYIQNDGIYDEAVEAKCLSSALYVRAWLENQIPEDYHAQCVQYFVVNEELQTLYFVLYDPRIAMHPLHIIELSRDGLDDTIADYKHQQKEFLQEVEEKLAQIVTI